MPNAFPPSNKIVSRNRFATVLLVLLLVVLSVQMGRFENDCLYHPDGYIVEDPWIGLREAFSQQVEEVRFAAEDGTILNGAYIPSSSDKPTVIFAHGNAGHMGDRAGVLQQIAAKGYGVFAFDYRGFGKSQGTPNEKGLYQDLTAASQWLSQSKATLPSNQIAMGESLGGAVVIDAATRIPFRAVVVYSTFSNIPQAAPHVLDAYVPGVHMLPWQLIIQQKYDSLAKASRLTMPLLIVHGEKDEMFPPEVPQVVYQAASSMNKRFVVIPFASHNTLFQYGGAQVLDELDALLAQPQHDP